MKLTLCIVISYSFVVQMEHLNIINISTKHKGDDRTQLHVVVMLGDSKNVLYESFPTSVTWVTFVQLKH